MHQKQQLVQVLQKYKHERFFLSVPPRYFILSGCPCYFTIFWQAKSSNYSMQQFTAFLTHCPSFFTPETFSSDLVAFLSVSFDTLQALVAPS